MPKDSTYLNYLQQIFGHEMLGSNKIFCRNLIVPTQAENIKKKYRKEIKNIGTEHKYTNIQAMNINNRFIFKQRKVNVLHDREENRQTH